MTYLKYTNYNMNENGKKCNAVNCNLLSFFISLASSKQTKFYRYKIIYKAQLNLIDPNKYFFVGQYRNKNCVYMNDLCCFVLFCAFCAVLCLPRVLMSRRIRRYMHFPAIHWMSIFGFWMIMFEIVINGRSTK